MKFFNTIDNRIPKQTQMELSSTSQNTRIIRILALIVSVAFFNFRSPLIAQSKVAETNIPVKATEHTATIEMAATNNASSSLETFTLDINVNPGGQAINAVGVFFGFASSSIKAIDINTDNSFCDFFIETSINQEAGGINIFCGKPYPGVATTSNIARITFQKNTVGWTNFEIKQNSLVLANDGLGTNILKEINSLDVLIN